MQTTIANGYLPPSDEAIQQVADSVELKIKTPDFIRDVCTIRANGRFMTAEELRVQAENEIAKKPILTKIYKDKSKIKGTIFQDPVTNTTYPSHAAAKDASIARHISNATNIRNAIEMLPSMEVPGNSPMQQAVNLLKLISEQKNMNKDSGDTPEDSILNSMISPKSMSKAKSALAEAKSMSQQERDMIEKLAELKDKRENEIDLEAEPPGPPEEGDETPGLGGKAISAGTATGHTATGQSILNTAIRLSDKQLGSAIKISRKLKSVSKLRVAKLTKFEPDVQADEIKDRLMKSYSELGKIKASQFASMVTTPGIFRYRSATNQYMVRERGKYTEKKQLLYILIDCSGSMVEDNGSRISLAAGVLINRLMAVADGDAVLYWRFFDTKSYDVKYIENKEDAYASISTVLNEENFNGGGTNFDVALTDAVEHIMSMKDTVTFTKPEIMLVTDGACNSQFTYSDLKGVRLHTAFVSHDVSPHIEGLTKEAGGVVLHLAE